jgi:alpha-mannosidase
MVTAADRPELAAIPGVPQLYTYNGSYRPDQILSDWDAYQQKSINDEILYLFGWGDGGGGPTIDMQEAALRLTHLAGFPGVEQGSVQGFFDRLWQRVWNDPHLPRWVGELYLELHRGTYTSQGWIKRANRKSELLYREAELWSSLAGTLCDGQAAMQRQQRLNEGWKLILFNQFHDVLPGSSIHEVYVDARADYERITDIGNTVSKEAIERIAGTVEGADGLLVFNPAPFERSDPVEVEARPDELGAFTTVDSQDLGDGRCLVAASAPPLGYAFCTGGTGNAVAGLRIERDLLENQFFRVRLGEDGTIASLVDKRIGREVLAPGERGNHLIAFEDRPRAWDAWDIQLNYRDKPYPIEDVSSWEVVEQGPLRGGIALVRRFGASTIRQRVLIYRDVPRIDFPTEIDWHEHQTLVKVAFPVSVHAQSATCDIQWGNVERPTHWNTSWDWARFETCAHKWVDLSEGDYGVSLLNDCKYGHDIRGHVMRLTLLRSPISPDPEADQGLHLFSYSLLPHLGDWRVGETVRHAYLFNLPPRGRAPGAKEYPADRDTPPSFSLIRTNRPGLVIETVKPAEDGDGLIVRCYEAHNTRGEATLEFGTQIASAEAVTMLEERKGPVEVTGNVLRFTVRPYGIFSFRVRLAGPSQTGVV